MKKIIVTGAGGFIGSHLTEKLVELGHDVKAFVRYNSRNNWGWLEDSSYKNEIEVCCGDIRDYDSVFNALKGCDTVFHLAALIGIPYSYVSPLAYIRTNVEGTYNILQSSKELRVENILVTSTSETFGTAQYTPIDEKHPLVGQSPYSASKISADQLSISFFRSFNLPIKIIRPFNTYGPRQSARAIIPTAIIQLLNDSKNLKFGNLHPTRDLTYVKDTVKGFIEIAKTDMLIGEVTNIGMNKDISMKELVQFIIDLMGERVEHNVDEQRIRPKKSEVDVLRCDNSKLMTNTNWKPDYDLRKGLLETIAWFKSHQYFYKSEIYNV